MSTSSMQRKTIKKIKRLFSKYEVIENSRPDWLISSTGGRLELDIFIPALNVAIEVQGKQHTEFISRFHATQKDFELQLQRDKEKAEICKRTGIKLFYVYSENEIDEIGYHVLDFSTHESGFEKIEYNPYKPFEKENQQLDIMARSLKKFMNNPNSKNIGKKKALAIRTKINKLIETGNAEHKYIAEEARRFLSTVHIKRR